ncbi:calcium/proton exchanger [Rugosimonospora acidiphila]|uniref:Ca(2+)/H(+) antiporter n=1 Tax=Rugosimonospora acidiphila TaxID=556531 RepID=A0ABP9SI28_9ACTN
MPENQAGSPSTDDRTANARTLTRSDVVIFVGGAIGVVAAGLTRFAHTSAILAFVCAAVAVAVLAALVARSVEQMGDRFGAGATGVLQGALGNLPELFISFFALRAGLRVVVQSAIIGSMLANLLLVLGAAFVVGGLKHGTQRFERARARDTSVLLVLATAALVLPSMAQFSHSPAAPHLRVLSDTVAVVLLIVFVLSLPAALARRAGDSTGGGKAAAAAPAAKTAKVAQGNEPPRWPIWLAVGLLAASGGASALVSDWFVHALQPAITTLHLSQAFAGLVVVAIAGNAIEHVVGIRLAYLNQSDYALSVILNSPLQVALLLAPALVLLSLTTATTLTLVFAPMLVAAVVVTVVLVTLIVFDGESNWLEGSILIGLYVIIAAVFWWG